MSTYGSIRTNERALLQKQTDFRPDIGKNRPMGGPNVVQCSGPSLNVLVTRPDIAAPACGHLFKLMQMICFGVLARGQPQATAADLYQAIAPGVRRLY